MNRYLSLFLLVIISSSLVLFGCSSSEETQQEKEVLHKETPETKETPPEVMAEKADTIDVSQNEQMQPDAGQQPSQEQMLSEGMYAVQVGAFKASEKADEIAALARNRFSASVRTFYDNETGLTKILLGSFATKEEARTFRDQIAKQFPEEYKDAWVTDLPKQ